jgi:glyoxylase-like metal-dependent hydrolase (beta-lactamase superfamily II)
LIDETKATIEVERDVADQLKDANVSIESVNAITLSHYHIDHFGDPSLFPPCTSLVVGPGFKSNKISFPGYPKNPNALTVDDAFHEREIIGLDFSTDLEINGFPTIDYFGDGSFYILQAQGHSQLRIHSHLFRFVQFLFTNQQTFIPHSS